MGVTPVGHLFVTILAYHLSSGAYHTVQVKAGAHPQQLVQYSETSVHSEPSDSIPMQCKNGSTVHIKKSIRPELGRQQAIYSVLDVKRHPGSMITMTI